MSSSLNHSQSTYGRYDWLHCPSPSVLCAESQTCTCFILTRWSLGCLSSFQVHALHYYSCVTTPVSLNNCVVVLPRTSEVILHSLQPCFPWTLTCEPCSEVLWIWLPFITTNLDNITMCVHISTYLYMHPGTEGSSAGDGCTHTQACRHTCIVHMHTLRNNAAKVNPS